MRYVQQFPDEDVFRYEVLISDCETTGEWNDDVISFQTLMSDCHCTKKEERGETRVAACR